MKRPIVVNWWVKKSSNTVEKTNSKGMSYQIYQLLHGKSNGKVIECNDAGIQLKKG